jgi:ATP-binding cassette subfamily F protein uup
VLAPESDSVVFQGREIHVASWARRFKFSFEQLHQPFDTLSGGEKARARVAHLMLQTPDVLILDEPTNDLDIETLEMLEQSITEFKGAIVLVSHDRFMLTRVCTHFLGLDGAGGSREYAEYQQWEYDMLNPAGSNREAKPVDASSGGRGNTRTKRLSYQEQREFDGMEAAIAKSERKVEEFEEQVTLENNRGNAERLSEVCLQLADAQKLVEKLYTRWAELEEKQK